MRILMLGNSFTAANDLPQRLAQLTGAEVMAHTRGGARLAEQLNPKTKLGARTKAALEGEPLDFVILQEMSHGPISSPQSSISSPQSFFNSVERLCEWIRAKGATPVLFATWAYEKGGAKLAAKGWDYEDMARQLSATYRQAAQENHALLAEVGQRFYDLSPTHPLYAADGVHPNEAGTQLAAEVLAETILTHKELTP